MYLSADDIEMLLEFAERDTDADRDLHTADLEMWLYRLKKNATHAGLDAYNQFTSPPHSTPDQWPWSAVRTVDVGRPANGWPAVKATLRAPPAFFLIYSRKPELEPLRPGDDVTPVNVPGDKWSGLWQALTTWHVPGIRARLTPNGWRPDPSLGLGVPPEPEFSPPLIDPIVIPRPPSDTADDSTPDDVAEPTEPAEPAPGDTSDPGDTSSPGDSSDTDDTGDTGDTGESSTGQQNDPGEATRPRWVEPVGWAVGLAGASVAVFLLVRHSKGAV